MRSLHIWSLLISALFLTFAPTLAYSKPPCTTIKVCLPLANEGNRGAQKQLALIYTMRNKSHLLQEDKFKRLGEIENAQIEAKNAERYGNAAIKWFKKLAAENDPEILHILGNKYYHGSMVAQDNQEAHAYYTKAAKLGHWESQYILGQMYNIGERIGVDRIKAYAWLKAALSSSNRLKIEGLQRKRKFMTGISENIHGNFSEDERIKAEKLSKEYILNYVERFKGLSETHQFDK